jgi:hypothetical protein
MRQEALRAILDTPALTPEQRHRLQAVGSGDAPTVSPEAQEMLRALGKTLIRAVSEDEWSHYIERRGLTLRDPLLMERAEWVLPDQRFMELTGWTPRTWWRWVHDHAKTAAVRMNALAELRKLGTA